MQFTHSAVTDVGRKRAHNEDSLAFHLGGSPDRLVLIVADGMGGHSAGDFASQVAVQTFRERLLAGGMDPRAGFRSAAEISQSRIRAEVGEKGEGKGVGTTVVGLVVEGTRAWVGHIGDSRAYRIRNGVIEQLTRDHSWVAEQLASGNLTVEQAAQHPFRNVLTRSLGTASENQEIDVSECDVLPGDRYILCSDGLYGLVSDAEIATAALSLPPDQASRYLVDLANSRGGRDNITVQVLAFPSVAPLGTTRGLVGVLALAACVMVAFLLWAILAQPTNRDVVRGGAKPLGEETGSSSPLPVAAQASPAPAPPSGVPVTHDPTDPPVTQQQGPPPALSTQPPQQVVPGGKHPTMPGNFEKTAEEVGPNTPDPAPRPVSRPAATAQPSAPAASPRPQPSTSAAPPPSPGASPPEEVRLDPPPDQEPAETKESKPTATPTFENNAPPGYYQTPRF